VIPLTDSFVALISGLIDITDAFLLLVLYGAGHAVWQRRKSLFPRTDIGWYLFPRRGLLGLLVAPVLIWGLRELQVSLPHLPHTAARVSSGLFVIALLSGLLFAMKIRALRWYAILEGVFALWVCVSTLYGMADRIQPVQIGSLFASAYLFIRAADNFKKDWDAKKAVIRKFSGEQCGLNVPYQATGADIYRLIRNTWDKSPQK
jgi:hypothetical protein